MFDSNDILIVGDSFSNDRKNPNSWVLKLTHLLTGNHTIPRGEGFKGCAWWSSRSCILNEYNLRKPKLLIVIHTDPLRLASDYNFPLSAGSIEQKLYDPSKSHPYLAEFTEDVAIAARYYFKYLMSMEFHFWSQNQLFVELDELSKNTEYVIHLRSFKSPPKINYTFKHGMYIEDTLFENSSQYQLYLENKNDLSKFFQKDDELINHLTVEENDFLAHKLHHAIQTYNVGPRTLNLSKMNWRNT